MRRKKITVKDIQQYLGLSCVQSVYRWLNGYSMPTIDHLYALSELFQMPIDDMVMGNRIYRATDFNGLFGKRMFAYYTAVIEQYAHYSIELQVQ